MKLSEFCIERPVFASVISLILIIFGAMGFVNLEVRYLPQTFQPSITVETGYPGASASLVEETITTPLETALAGTANLDVMQSSSSQAYSQIQLNFKAISKQDFILAESDVMKAISMVRLPQSVNSPKIFTGGRHHQNLLLIAGIYSDAMSQNQLIDYVSRHIVNQLQQIPGVAQVNQWSASNALRVSLNPARLAEFNVTTQDVVNALEANNVDVSLGQLTSDATTFPINASSSLSSILDFNNLVIAKQGNNLIRLSQLGTVIFDISNIGGAFTRVDGKQGVGLGIQATDDANPIALGKTLRQTLSLMQQNFPQGMHSVIVVDFSKSVREAVSEVFKTIMVALVLVSLVTLLFLGRPRFALIPFVTIPVCIIATFGMMYVFGFSIDVMTLLALVLAVGLVVDDAIVVLENIHRHTEAGELPLTAAKIGMREISFAVIAMTITLIAVYAPSAMMSGTAATYFQCFAFTLASAVLISGIVALTLTPMMCGKLLSNQHQSPYEEKLEQIFDLLKNKYRVVLVSVLNKSKWVAALFILLLCAGVWLFHSIPSGLMPRDYAGIVGVMMQGPDNASMNYMYKANKIISQKLMDLSEVEHAMSFGGGNGDSANQAFTFLQLKPEDAGNKATLAFAAKANLVADSLPSVEGTAFPININSSNNGVGQGQLQFSVMGLSDYETLSQAIANLTRVLKQNPMILDAESQLQFNSQQFNISINHDLATELNVPVGNITQTLSTLLGGYYLNTNYNYNGASYPIIIQLPVANLGNLNVLKNVYVENSQNQRIALSQFVTVTSVNDLPERDHLNQMRAGEVDVTLAGDTSFGQAINLINQTAAQVLPQGLQIGYMGEAKHLLEDSGSLNLMFMMGIVFIYLILAALFESFLDPLIILLTVPLCIVAAVVVLKLMGATLDLYTRIGLITLIGLVSKHGVLITQFANQLRNDGKSIKEAVIEAASIRLRPILMTTATMVLGALPLLLATGSGENGRLEIGSVVVAGLLFGTVFSLLVVPVAYVLFKSKLKP